MLKPSDVSYAVDYHDDFSWSDLAWEDHDTDYLVIDGEIYPFKVVDAKNGTEGDWNCETHVIIQIGDQFFRKTGRYQSHEGTHWDGKLTEVEISYEKIQVWKDK